MLVHNTGISLDTAHNTRGQVFVQALFLTYVEDFVLMPTTRALNNSFRLRTVVYRQANDALEEVLKVNQKSPFDATMPRSNVEVSLRSEESLGGIGVQDASKSGMPFRQPTEPPEALQNQRFEGFVRFLKGHVSPNHNRVTADGRIVPTGPKSPPPTFHRDFIETLDSVLLNKGRVSEVGKENMMQGSQQAQRPDQARSATGAVHETGSSYRLPVLPPAGSCLKLPYGQGVEIVQVKEDGTWAVLLIGGVFWSFYLTETGETNYVDVCQVNGPYPDFQAQPRAHYWANESQQAPMASSSDQPVPSYLPAQADHNGGFYHQMQQPQVIGQHNQFVSGPNAVSSYEHLQYQLSIAVQISTSLKAQLNELEKFHALHDTTMPAIDLQRSLNHKADLVVQLDATRRWKDSLEHEIRSNIQWMQSAQFTNLASEDIGNESYWNAQARAFAHAQSFNTSQQNVHINTEYNGENPHLRADNEGQPGRASFQGQKVKNLSPSAPAFVPKAMAQRAEEAMAKARSAEEVRDHLTIDPATGKKVRFATSDDLETDQRNPIEGSDETRAKNSDFINSEQEEVGSGDSWDSPPGRPSIFAAASIDSWDSPPGKYPVPMLPRREEEDSEDVRHGVQSAPDQT